MIDLEPLRHFLVVFGISLVRITAATAITPFLSTGLIEGRTRNSILFAWGLMIYPIVAPTMTGELGSTLNLLGLIVKELVIGILIGFTAAKVFWIAMSVGFFVDNQRGASMASSMDPASGEETSPLGEFLQQVMIVLFYSGGGLLLFLSGVLESYVLWPVDSFYPQLDEAFPEFVLQVGDELTRLVVVLAAPIIIAVFLSEFGLGLVNRFAPSLNVFSLAMPVKSLVALIVLVLYLPFLLTHLETKFRGDASVVQFFRGLFE